MTAYNARANAQRPGLLRTGHNRELEDRDAELVSYLKQNEGDWAKDREGFAMQDLIAELEAAPAEDQQRLIEKAIRLVFEREWISREVANLALLWNSHKAYESAALTLVDENSAFEIWRSFTGVCHAEIGNGDDQKGATLALALTIAALKAKP